MKVHDKGARPLHLDAATFRVLLELQGPSLGLWRAAEIAALREQAYEPPVLDLGCGDGLVTSMVLPRVEVGLDPDEKALAQAARRGIYARFEAMPAEEARLAVETIARVLRPGGRLIFTVPTDVFSRWLALPLSCYATWRNDQLCHINLWSTEGWISQLRQVGLEVEEIRPYLRHELVSAWDALELLQQIWIGRRRLVGIAWRRIPATMLDRLAQWASRLDLSAWPAGGGRLIVARKV